MQKKKSGQPGTAKLEYLRKRYRKYHEKYPFLELPVDEMTPEFPRTMESCICGYVICHLPTPPYPSCYQDECAQGAFNLLHGIHLALMDGELDDFDCVERIICLFEAFGIDCGERHSVI